MYSIAGIPFDLGPVKHRMPIETLSAAGRYGQRLWAFTPSGGGDMEIQKACLIYNVVTSVCLRHN